MAKGKFPFNVPPTKPIFLTSVRDMGRLAGMCIRAPDKYARRTIDVASDVRTTKQVNEHAPTLFLLACGSMDY